MADQSSKPMAQPGPAPEAGPSSTAAPQKPAVDPRPTKPPWSQRIVPQLVVAVVVAVAAVAGSMAVWGTHEMFHVPAAEMPMVISPEMQSRIDRYNFWNAFIGFGCAGAIICATVGACTGLLRRSGRAAGLGVVAGLIVGFLAGAAGGPANVKLDARLVPYEMDDIFRTMLVHLPNWTLLGAAVGVVLCVTAGAWRQRIGEYFLAGIGAGVLAAVAYPLVIVVAMPTVYSATMAVPVETPTRLLLFAIGGAFLGWGAARVVLLHRAAAVHG